MVSVALFIDDLLVKCYNLEPFYHIKTRRPCRPPGNRLAPHTSPGVLARIIGFTRANVGCTPTRSSMPPNGGTASLAIRRIGVYSGRKWEKVPIRKFVLENFDSQPTGHRPAGTYLFRIPPARSSPAR